MIARGDRRPPVLTPGGPSARTAGRVIQTGGAPELHAHPVGGSWMEHTPIPSTTTRRVVGPYTEALGGFGRQAARENPEPTKTRGQTPKLTKLAGEKAPRG